MSFGFISSRLPDLLSHRRGSGSVAKAGPCSQPAAHAAPRVDALSGLNFSRYSFVASYALVYTIIFLKWKNDGNTV